MPFKKISYQDSNCHTLCTETITNKGIVCVPTDTVYGLICSAKNKETIRRLSFIKNRPVHKPFALFVPSLDFLRRFPVSLTNDTLRLAQHFWPGALTLVIPASDEIPCAYKGSVGVRCPNDALVLKIMETLGEPLVNTSCNRSGEEACLSLEGRETLLAQVDLVVDGGTLPESAASTIVDCREETCKILRAGTIHEVEIAELLNMNYS